LDRCFYCETIPPAGDTVILSEIESQHLQSSLRLRGETEIHLLNGAGQSAAAAATPAAAGRRRGLVHCRIIEHQHHPEPVVKLILFVVPPRAKAMARIIRQATELGVWEIHSVIARRSVRLPAATVVDGWNVHVREAAKQSGNPFFPTIHTPIDLTELAPTVAIPCHYGAAPGSRVVGSSADTPRRRHVFPAERIKASGGRVGLWIGPEGGFDVDETAAVQASGALPLVVGCWTLRVETAVVAGLSRLTTMYRGMVE